MWEDRGRGREERARGYRTQELLSLVTGVLDAVDSRLPPCFNNSTEDWTRDFDVHTEIPFWIH
jgi:hypothetical protein